MPCSHPEKMGGKAKAFAATATKAAGKDREMAGIITIAVAVGKAIPTSTITVNHQHNDDWNAGWQGYWNNTQGKKGGGKRGKHQ